jgi:glutamate dehydrogenase
VRAASARLTAGLHATGAPEELAARVVRLFDLDGVVGLSDLGVTLGIAEEALTRAYTRLGQALGLDWAQGAATRLAPTDPWERLLVAGLVREFEQLRLTFLSRRAGTDPQAGVEAWLEENAPRVAQFATTVDRARQAAQPNAAMLAQIAGQARVLLAR